VPFVWLRTSASSFAPVRYQTNSGGILSILGNDRAFDGVQFWWSVRDIGSGAQGWGEQNSLEAIASPPTTTPGTPPATATAERWNVFARVRIKLSVPFSWLRNFPGSYASVNSTSPSGSTLEILGGPQTDTVQWWWLVRVPGTNNTGWVEQKSLEIVPQS
jgi:hypothetical protein